MLPGLLLLTLLVGILEVNAVPFDKGSRQEELVTRCIVEVLSNALAKPNAPPIDLECREILKKSSRHNQDDREDELKHYETRTIKDSPNLDQHQHNSKEQTEQSLDLTNEENEEKRHHAESESREEEEDEGKVKETEHPDDNEESTGHSKERSFAEDEKNEDDEERGPHKDHFEKEDIEKRNKYHHSDSHEAKHDIIDKKSYHTDKNTEDLHGKDDEEETRNLEEIIKRHPLSKNWKELLYHPDKYHSLHSNENLGENEEEEEQQEEKRSYKPSHEELRQRLFGYDEKRSHHDELRNHISSDEKTLYPRGQKSRYGEASFENHLLKNDFDKRFLHEKESSEESREKRHHHQGSEEWTEHHDSSEESNEKEMNAHYEDKRQNELRKKWPSQQNSRISYVQSKEDSDESEEDIDKRHEHENQEKEDFYRKLKHHLQGSDEDEPFKPEKKQEEKRHYIGEEMVDEMKRYYPEFPPEKEGKHHNYRGDSEEAKFPFELYKPNHAEEERKSFNKHRLASDPLRWRSRYFENVDNSEEERKRSLQVKNIFPDYGDYDLWGKRQFLDDMNREYGEKISPSKTHKFEEKRQYDRMDELAQLLNYKKKSVEFPDFYDSGEIKKRHFEERGRFNQRPLTEEEEKELENLAIMDLELQKIAEKLSNNRQG